MKMEVLRNNSNSGRKKIKMLDMTKNDEFRYLLEKTLKELPDSLRGSLFGTIYAKASKFGINSAREYVIEKRKEGVIDEATSRKLIDLLFEYSTYR
ncbi:MAG: hypothetical protein RXN92_06410 [Thermoplasmatales archaeon]|jgi:hypothetical protein